MIESNQLQIGGTFQLQVSIGIQDEVIPIPDLVHEKSELYCGVNKATRHTHIWSTVNLDVVDSFLKTSVLQTKPYVQLRVGISNGSGTFWFPWQKHVIVYTDAIPSGKGYLITLVTGDILEVMSHQYRTRFFHGKIQDLVLDVATFNGLKAVVEPTSGQWSYIQSNQTDFEFLQKLAERAVTTDGRGGFRFFIQDDVLHFHTLNYVATLRNVNVFSLAGTKLSLLSRVQDSVDDGSPGVQVVGIDVQTGNSYAILSDEDNLILHGNQTPDLVPLGPLVVSQHPSWNGIDEIRAIGQSKFDNAHANIFNAIVTLESGYLVQLNDLLRIIMQQSSAQQSPWSGLYTVIAVTHTVAKGTTHSVMKLQRGEFSSPTVNKTTADGAINVANFVAKGRPINLTDVNTSSQTKGPPDLFTGGRFVKTVETVA